MKIYQNCIRLFFALLPFALLINCSSDNKSENDSSDGSGDNVAALPVETNISGFKPRTVLGLHAVKEIGSILLIISTDGSMSEEALDKEFANKNPDCSKENVEKDLAKAEKIQAISFHLSTKGNAIDANGVPLKSEFTASGDPLKDAEAGFGISHKGLKNVVSNMRGSMKFIKMPKAPGEIFEIQINVATKNGFAKGKFRGKLRLSEVQCKDIDWLDDEDNKGAALTDFVGSCVSKNFRVDGGFCLETFQDPKRSVTKNNCNDGISTGWTFYAKQKCDAALAMSSCVFLSGDSTQYKNNLYTYLGTANNYSAAEKQAAVMSGQQLCHQSFKGEFVNLSE